MQRVQGGTGTSLAARGTGQCQGEEKRPGRVLCHREESYVTQGLRSQGSLDFTRGVMGKIEVDEWGESDLTCILRSLCWGLPWWRSG